MAVNYAIRETKSSPLASTFAREFMERQFGKLATDAIYDAAPKYKRGPSKGQPKGWVMWEKCIKGGWVRTGAYDHDSMRGNGFVMAPGTHNVRVLFTHPAYANEKTVSLEAGQRRGLPTDVNRETDEQWAIRCKRAVLQITGQPVPEELKEAPYVPPFSEKKFIEDVLRHYVMDVQREGNVPNFSKPESIEAQVMVALANALQEVGTGAIKCTKN